MLRPLPLVFLIVFLSACDRKNEDGIVAKGPAIRLIQTNYFSNASTPSRVERTRYIYDQNNTIQEIITDKADGTPYSKLQFRWINKNTLRIEQHYTNPPWSGTYQSNLPLKMYSYAETVYRADTTILERKTYTVTNGKAEYRSSTKFEYDSQKRILKRNIYTTDNKLASSTTYEYDNRGNVIRESGTQVVYEYDTAPNPYKPIRVDAEISWFMSPNNIVRQKSTNPASGTNTDEKWTYEYRSDGYPTRMIYADGRKEEFIYSN